MRTTKSSEEVTAAQKNTGSGTITLKWGKKVVSLHPHLSFPKIITVSTEKNHIGDFFPKGKIMRGCIQYSQPLRLLPVRLTPLSPYPEC